MKLNQELTVVAIKSSAEYVTDLDFADEIMLASDDAINSQKQLNSVNIMARLVGSKINRKSPIQLRVSANLVEDFKYSGSWVLDCTKDFEIRKATRLLKIWRSNSISSDVNIKLFRACVESTLLYNAVTWTLDTLSRKFLLHKAVTLCIEL
jgi:hypothetical protein